MVKETFGQRMARERKEHEQHQYARLQGAIKRKKQLLAFGLRDCDQDLRSAVIALQPLNARLELVLMNNSVYIQIVEYEDA